VFHKNAQFFQLLNNLFAPIKKKEGDGYFTAPGIYIINIYQLYCCT
jgi:hypothetical protein